MTTRALALALACGAAGRSAHAQDATALAARRELIEQAQQARTAGDHARALDLAERAARIATNASVRLFIAQEHNALGHTADAYGEASRCAAEAAGDAALPNRATVMAVCRALATQLRARVGRVTVRMPAVVPQGAAVTVAGRALGEPLWGVPYPVTPGPVVIEASAPGHQAFRREIALGAGGSEEVAVALTPDAHATVSEVPTAATMAAATTSASTAPSTNEPVPASSGAATGPGVASSGATSSEASQPGVWSSSSSSSSALAPATGRDREGQLPARRLAGYIALGVGGALLLATVPLVVVREVSRLDCPDNACPDPRTLARVRDTVYGVSAAAVGTVALGLAGVVAGIVLVATAPPSAASRRALDRAAARPRAVLTGALLPEGGALLGAAGRF